MDFLGPALGISICFTTLTRYYSDYSFFQVPDLNEVMIPFSDKMSDFDGNGDGCISYEEFVSAVERTVRLADNEELLEPFIIADLDG